MTIKYEPVFGDQSLFEGMPSDCEFISGAYGYKVKNDSLFYCEKYNPKYGWACACVDTSDFKPDAARRIIKTPTWTRADQEAGVLPEVGCVVMAIGVNEVARIAAINNDSVCSVCVVFEDGDFITLNFSGIAPIETPEEKAQREQEEFVASFNSEKYSNPTLYREGLRDAYRKLKAPTND